MYELPAQGRPAGWPFYGSLLGVVAVTLLLVLLRGRWPAGLAAWIYSALMILPISGVVHSGFQLAHDRYSYCRASGSRCSREERSPGFSVALEPGP